MNKTNHKYYIFPLLIILSVIVLSLLNLHGSSIGIYSSILFAGQEDKNIILGSPRAIRSDEYLSGTPLFVSQDINNEPSVNKDLGEGTNLSISHNTPTRDIFSIFEPESWMFFLGNNSELAYAAFWWLRIGIMLLGIYLLLLEITNKNLFLSILGSLLFLCTPFIQWWMSADPMTQIGQISFGIYFFIKLVKNNNKTSTVIYSALLAYTIIAFGLVLYPPFQIPLAWVAIFLAIGILIKNRKDILKDKNNIKRLIISLLSIIITVIGFALAFYLSYKDVLQLTTNTVYPGARFVSAGQGSLYQLFNGFYNILMQKDFNGAPFANQSEASNFFILSLPLIVWVIYKSIYIYKEKHTIDYIGLSITACLIFFSAFYFLPLPDFFSKYTGMYMVPSGRMYIGIGFANYILILYMLTKDYYKVLRHKISDWIVALSISILTGILIYKTGHFYYNLNPQSFAWPIMISANIKILMATIFVSIIVALLLFGYKKIFITLFLIFGIVSTIYINPLYKGLDILINTDLANYIKEVSMKDDSKWVAYNNIYLAQYALANNASIINGVHQYPQFEIWKILDPQKEYINIYNRYAHINISEYEQGEEYIKLLYPDSLEINISPCDKKLDSLNVKYVITNKKMSYSCLELKKDFSKYGITIYDRVKSITPSSF